VTSSPTGPPHAKLPDPPSPQQLRALARQDDDVLAVATHTVLWRIHATTGGHVVPWNQLRRFGPLDGRFDPHQPPPHEQAEGVLYLALDAPTCLAEVFQSTRVVNRTDRAPYLTGFRLTRTVRLLDLHGTWITRAGGSQAVNTSARRALTQAWARAIRAAHPELDGLWHPSSMYAGRPCVTLFERAADALPEQAEVSLPLSHPALADALAVAAAEVGYLVL
jgi:hypothetical protein